MLHNHFLLAFLSFVPATARPSNYRLRVQTVRYENVVVNGRKQQQKTILRQIQLHIRRDVPFDNEVILGDHELVLKGKLQSSETGKRRLQIHYEDSRLTDQQAPDEHGRWHRLKETTSAKTALELRVGEEKTIGGMTLRDGKKSSEVQIRAALLPVPSKKRQLKKRRPRGPRPIHTDRTRGALRTS